VVFWNTSESKAAMFGGHYTPGTGANIYLGPEERGYIRVLQDFTSHLDPDVHMAPVSLSSPTLVRGYALVSKNSASFYLQHAASHTMPVENAELSFDFSPLGRQPLIGKWIDPATGTVLSRVKVLPGLVELQVPPFKVDLALSVRPEQPDVQSEVGRR
jgi:hypothetical protein